MISKNQEGCTLDELCEQLQMPKTSAYDIVTTLVSLGMVNLNRGQRQRYTIGLNGYRSGSITPTIWILPELWNRSFVHLPRSWKNPSFSGAVPVMKWFIFPNLTPGKSNHYYCNRRNEEPPCTAHPLEKRSLLIWKGKEQWKYLRVYSCQQQGAE